MTGYVLIAVMAFLKACADAFENENFFESIFKHWNQRFWYKRESWKYAKKLFGYKFDAWHITWTLIVVCIGFLPSCEFWGAWWVILLNVGLIWNMVFKLFYHGVFKIK
jgi:hypothetical protein